MQLRRSALYWAKGNKVRIEALAFLVMLKKHSVQSTINNFSVNKVSSITGCSSSGDASVEREGSGMAVVMSDGEPGKLTLSLGERHAGETFFDALGGLIESNLGKEGREKLQAFFFTLGVSPWVWGAIRNPVFAAAIAANIAAVAAGQAPQYIVTYEVMFTIGLITLGGQGSPLPLIVMMLRSKSKKLRQFAKVTIGPEIFNISEPVMYGLPIVFNPILMIPMWINSIIGPLLLWAIFRLGLLSIPAISLQTGSLPAPITTVLMCQDWRASSGTCSSSPCMRSSGTPSTRPLRRRPSQMRKLQRTQRQLERWQFRHDVCKPGKVGRRATRCVDALAC